MLKNHIIICYVKNSNFSTQFMSCCDKLAIVLIELGLVLCALTTKLNFRCMRIVCNFAQRGSLNVNSRRGIKKNSFPKKGKNFHHFSPR